MILRKDIQRDRHYLQIVQVIDIHARMHQLQRATNENIPIEIVSESVSKLKGPQMEQLITRTTPVKRSFGLLERKKKVQRSFFFF